MSGSFFPCWQNVSCWDQLQGDPAAPQTCKALHFQELCSHPHIRANSGMWFTCLTQPLLLKAPHGGLLLLSKLFQCITAHNDTEHWEPDYLCSNSGGEQEPVALIILFMSKLGFAPHSPFNISENLYPLTLLDNSLASLKLTSFNILVFFPQHFYNFMRKGIWYGGFIVRGGAEHLLLCEKRHFK